MADIANCMQDVRDKIIHLIGFLSVLKRFYLFVAEWIISHI